MLHNLYIYIYIFFLIHLNTYCYFNGEQVRFARGKWSEQNTFVLLFINQQSLYKTVNYERRKSKPDVNENLPVINRLLYEI